MLFWLLQSILLSVVIILVIHNILHFFTDTLTIPKVKDLVHQTKTQYKEIDSIIHYSGEKDATFTSMENNNDGKVDSKLELKNFLKSQLKETSEVPTGFSSIMESNDFSIYDV
jgi:hypothetical protein